MDLILWRHADAEPGSPDLQRALTQRGHKQARRMAEWLGAQLPDRCTILVSPALRTVQTVEALDRPFKVVPELAPDAAPHRLLRLAKWPDGKEAVLIVGHQPTLGQLAARLLTGREQDWDVKKGSVWWFSQRGTDKPGEAASVRLRAVIAPDQLVR